MKNTKKWILGILLFDVLLLSWAFGQKKHSGVKPQPAEAVNATGVVSGEEGNAELFVLKEKDEENHTITVLHVAKSREETLSYSGATSVRNRYDEEMAMDGLQEGEMVDVVYDAVSGRISRIKISEQAWEYQKVQKIKMEGDRRRIQIGDKNYRVNEHLLIFSGSECIDWMDVNDVDELTVKGVEENIYSLIVTKGHGYIRPSNYDAFVGGMVSVGRDVICPITQDMLIVVREGDYTVTMQNGELVGTKSVVVTRNREAPLDMASFKPEPEHAGKVDFEITPYGADLYINGKLTDYNEAVTLNYGKHEIRVSLTGYEDYNAVLDVQTPSPTIVIDLADDNSEVNDEDDEGDAKNQATNLEGTSNNPNIVNTVVDQDHVITVSEPTGVNVYFNGVYKGTSPCSFPKQIGTHTITLSKAGYTTKSYTVEIADDKENVEWKFPAIQ